MFKNNDVEETRQPQAEDVGKEDPGKKENDSKKKKKKRKKGLKHALKKLPAVAISVAVIAAALYAIPTFIIPLITPAPENQYLSTSDLEEVVNINNLSTVNFFYSGIAVKYKQDPNTKSQKQKVDYRIKYTTDIRVTFDMSMISFSEPDEESKTITVYLPEPIIEISGIDADSIGYLPEGQTDLDLQVIINLCREDAVHEVSEDAQISERAYTNLEDTIRGLTLPIIGDEYTLVFVKMAEGDSYDQPTEDGDNIEASNEDTTEEGEANNETQN